MKKKLWFNGPLKVFLKPHWKCTQTVVPTASYAYFERRLRKLECAIKMVELLLRFGSLTLIKLKLECSY